MFSWLVRFTSSNFGLCPGHYGYCVVENLDFAPESVGVSVSVFGLHLVGPGPGTAVCTSCGCLDLSSIVLSVRCTELSVCRMLPRSGQLEAWAALTV